MNSALINQEQNTFNGTPAIDITTVLPEVTPELVFNQASTSPTLPEHTAYLELKGISLEEAQGVRFGKYHGHTALLVPLRGLDGEVKSIQYIYVDSEGKTQKRFYKGADKNGAFFSLDAIEEGSTIFITEGWSTAVSLKEIVGASGTIAKFNVVCAFSAQDLPKVAKVLQERFGYSEIIATPDADDAGSQAAKECQNIGVYAVFPPQTRKGMDWNNLLQEMGVNGAVNEFGKSWDLKGSEAITPIPEIANILENLDEDPCKNLSLEHFSPVLRRYIESVCETTEAHPIMIVMSVLCTISSFVGTKVCIPKGAYFQTLYPNIWSLCINKSGGFKSTALNAGASIAIKKQKDVLGKIKEMERYEYDKWRGKKKLQEDIDDFDQQSLEEELKSPVLPNRQTTEFLMKHLSLGHEGMIVASELGEWLKNLEKSHNGDLKAIFTHFYDVDIAPYLYRTKVSGNYTIEKPFVSINAVSTIDWIKDNVKAEDIFSGFFARFLLFAPPYEDVMPSALPGEHKACDLEAEWKIKETLENIGSIEFSIPKVVKARFEMVHSSLYQMVKTGKYDERCQKFLEPYLKRWSPYILKIAMLLRIIEDPCSSELSEASIKGATEIIRVAIKSTAKLFEKELGESRDQSKQRVLFENIAKRARDGKRVTFENLVKSRVLSGGSKEYEETIETLVNAGKISCANSGIKNKKDREYVVSQG